MLRITSLLASIALLGALAKTGGCQVQTVVGSGVMQTVTFEVASFDAVRIGHTFSATIVQGEEHSVVVTADDNIMERIVVTVSDSILRVDFGGPINLQNATLSVAITVPTLTDLRLSGASKAELDDIATDGKFFLGLSGASEVFGELAAESLRIALSGASEASLTGLATSLDLTMSGASNANLSYYPVATMKGSLSGASHAVVDVSDTLGPVKASGASSLKYFGQPELVDISTSGASTVEQG